MPGTLLTILVTLGIGLAVLAVIFVLGMRARSPLLLRPLVAFSKRVLNPRQLRTAGQPGAYASIIRCPGRLTGHVYDTPVGVVVTDEGFLIATPYGVDTQWLRNLLAAGEAILVTEGRTVAVDQPELIRMTTVATHFSASDRRLSRLLGITECVRLRDVGTVATANGAPTTGASTTDSRAA